MTCQMWKPNHWFFFGVGGTDSGKQPILFDFTGLIGQKTILKETFSSLFIVKTTI